MSGNRLVRTVVAFTGLLALSPSHGVAQVVHLSPYYKPGLANGTTLLKISPSQTGALFRVGAQDGQLVIIDSTGTAATISLVDRRIEDVRAEIARRYPTLQVTTNFPLMPARLLRGARRPVPLAGTADSVAFDVTPDGPDIGVGFGVIFSLSEDVDDSSGLLSQTGFQLDVVGSHRLWGKPVGDSAGWLDVLRSITPGAHMQIRLGLNADQQLPAEVGGERTEQGAPSDEFTNAVVEADQIALTAQAEFHWPLARNVEIFIVPDYALHYTQPDPFDFPLLSINEDLVDAESLFDARLVAEANDFYTAVLPLSSGGITGLFRFLGDTAPAFYAGGGVLRTETIRRGFEFQQDTVMVDDGAGGQEPQARVRPLSLRPTMDTPSRTLWRAVLGARIAGLLDLKVDAIGPLHRGGMEPILRMVLTREFTGGAPE